jgi:hypothetical protein
VVVAEQGRPFVAARADAEELGVQRVREIARAATRLECVG